MSKVSTAAKRNFSIAALIGVTPGVDDGGENKLHDDRKKIEDDEDNHCDCTPAAGRDGRRHPLDELGSQYERMFDSLFNVYARGLTAGFGPTTTNASGNNGSSGGSAGGVYGGWPSLSSSLSALYGCAAPMTNMPSIGPFGATTDFRSPSSPSSSADVSMTRYSLALAAHSNNFAELCSSNSSSKQSQQPSSLTDDRRHLPSLAQLPPPPLFGLLPPPSSTADLARVTAGDNIAPLPSHRSFADYHHRLTSDYRSPSASTNYWGTMTSVNGEHRTASDLLLSPPLYRSMNPVLPSSTSSYSSPAKLHRLDVGEDHLTPGSFYDRMNSIHKAQIDARSGLHASLIISCHARRICICTLYVFMGVCVFVCVCVCVCACV